MKSALVPQMTATKALSISELNSAIRTALGESFPSAQWVHGEVSGFRVNSSGHVYFDMVEKDEEKHSAVAKISCFLPAGLAKFIQGKLHAAGLEGLKDDIEIQVLADVTFYSPYGKLSLTIRDIEPAFTLGRMAQARQKIIEDLARRGLLEKNKLWEIPIVPLRVGLITSDGSAAYHDFLKTLRSSGFGFSIRFVSATMQGENTERDITIAIKTLTHPARLDLIAIVRGGGSKADLAWFDNQAIAEGIANSPCPILTGIGHEIDLSIADMCAHTSFKTPTAVAEFLCERVRSFLEALDDKSSLLRETSKEILQSHQIHLVEITQALPQIARLRLQEMRALTKQITWQKIAPVLQRAFERVKSQQERTRALDPIHVLRRGFTLTRGSDGRTLRSVQGVTPGSMICTVFPDGEAGSQVKNIQKSKVI